MLGYLPPVHQQKGHDQVGRSADLEEYSDVLGYYVPPVHQQKGHDQVGRSADLADVLR